MNSSWVGTQLRCLRLVEIATRPCRQAEGFHFRRTLTNSTIIPRATVYHPAPRQTHWLKKCCFYIHAQPFNNSCFNALGFKQSHPKSTAVPVRTPHLPSSSVAHEGHSELQYDKGSNHPTPSSASRSSGMNNMKTGSLVAGTFNVPRFLQHELMRRPEVAFVVVERVWHKQDRVEACFSRLYFDNLLKTKLARRERCC